MLCFYLISATLCACLSPVYRLGEETIILSFQYMFAFYILQHGHLLDSNLVQFLETFALRQPLVDKDGI